MLLLKSKKNNCRKPNPSNKTMYEPKFYIHELNVTQKETMLTHWKKTSIVINHLKIYCKWKIWFFLFNPDFQHQLKKITPIFHARKPVSYSTFLIKYADSFNNYFLYFEICIFLMTKICPKSIKFLTKSIWNMFDFFSFSSLIW
jgi:hypothetical protein